MRLGDERYERSRTAHGVCHKREIVLGFLEEDRATSFEFDRNLSSRGRNLELGDACIDVECLGTVTQSQSDCA